MYFPLGICLIFALLLVLNTAASLIASTVWRIFKTTAQTNWSARKQAGFIFALRIFPLLTALLLVSAFLIPSYFLFEPAESDETITLKLAVLTFLSGIGMLAAFYRVFGTWWKTRRLIKDWRRRGEPTKISGVNFPVYRLNNPFPVIAVVGVFHPQIFIAEQIFNLLTAEELAAAMAHEYGHLAARDNFKRTLLRVCRDLLVFPIGKSLDRIWAETAESAADEYAASGGGKLTAINLAAALVKIARIVPPNGNPILPAASFLIDGQTADITRRVRQLVRMTEGQNSVDRSGLNFTVSLWLILGVVSFPFFRLATDYEFLFAVHKTLENLVAILQ